MDTKAIGAETRRIVADGRYVAPAGHVVEIADAVRAARDGTVVYHPGDVIPRARDAATRPRIEVTDESTTAAARRLFEREGVADPCALNFASARNPGGGFLGGAKAQEEDLARASALYACLEPQRAYYDANRRERSALYTDHVIHSPRVPFFRDDRACLTDAVALVSVVTAPAPNAGAVGPEERALVRPTLERRAAIVLEVAARHGHRVLVLGAWGCGVFRNDPREVADVFARELAGRFAGAFDRVVFAILDRSRERATLRAFKALGDASRSDPG
jgi:uncharacterized protein (TIGR02452 family)